MQDSLSATSGPKSHSQSALNLQHQSSTAGGASSGASPLKTSPNPAPIHLKPKTTNVRRMRRIISEDAEWTLAIVPLLTELCIQHIVKNFQSEFICPGLEEGGPSYPGLEALSNSLPSSSSGVSCCSHPRHTHTSHTQCALRDFVLLWSCLLSPASSVLATSSFPPPGSF